MCLSLIDQLIEQIINQLIFAFQTFSGEVDLVVLGAFITTVAMVHGVAAASAIVRESRFTMNDLNFTNTIAEILKNHSVVELPSKNKGKKF